VQAEEQIKALLKSQLCRPKLKSLFDVLLYQKKDLELWAEPEFVKNRDPELQRQLYVYSKSTKSSYPMMYTIENAIMDCIKISQALGWTPVGFKPLGDLLDNIGNAPGSAEYNKR
jgi:hypothetical protein